MYVKLKEAHESLVNIDLILLFVSFKTSAAEVAALRSLLKLLTPNIAYAVAVNSNQSSQPIDELENDALLFLRYQDNLGYGRAINSLVSRLDCNVKYICPINTDIRWEVDTFGVIIDWLDTTPNISMVVPQIKNKTGEIQKLCKENPTLLAMLSRRMISSRFKPNWLKQYDAWYVMSNKNYNSIINSTYLSGCCMIIKKNLFMRVGGFDERFFLYLEDADITRSLAEYGRCVHFPYVSVTHIWGRGNYANLSLLLVNIKSLIYYFSKWGIKLW